MKGAEIIVLRSEAGKFVTSLVLSDGTILQINDGTTEKKSFLGSLISALKGWFAPELRISSRYCDPIWSHELAIHDVFHFSMLEGTTFFGEWLIGNKILTLYFGAEKGGEVRKLRHFRERPLEEVYPFVLDRENDVIDMGTLFGRDSAIGEEDCYLGNQSTGFSHKVAEIVQQHLSNQTLAGYRDTVGILNLEVRQNGLKPFDELPEYGDNPDLRYVAGMCLLPETVAALEWMNSEIRQEEKKLKARFWGEQIADWMIAHSSVEIFYPTKGMKVANMIELVRTTLASIQETYYYKSPRFVPYTNSEMMRKK